MSSPQSIPLILNLNSPQATLELVGGRGASLARMAAAGVPVPPGFHVTTAAYQRYVDENHKFAIPKPAHNLFTKLRQFRPIFARFEPVKPRRRYRLPCKWRWAVRWCSRLGY